MKFPFALLSIVPKTLMISKLNSPISQFWSSVYRNQTFFAFSDTKGNIFQQSESLSRYDKTYSNISNLNTYGKYGPYDLFSYETNSDESIKKTLILGPANFYEFDWQNTTSKEWIVDDCYLRINYFGEVTTNCLTNGDQHYYDLKFSSREYFQKIDIMDQYIFSINNFNILKIHAYSLDYSIMTQHFSQVLLYQSIIKKLEVKKYANFYHVMIVFDNNHVEVMTFIELDSKLTLFNKTRISDHGCNQILDITLNHENIVIISRMKIVVYEFSIVYKEYKKLVEKNYQAPYFTQAMWIENYLYLNNQKYIPMIKVVAAESNPNITSVLVGNNSKL